MSQPAMAPCRRSAVHRESSSQLGAPPSVTAKLSVDPLLSANSGGLSPSRPCVNNYINVSSVHVIRLQASSLTSKEKSVIVCYMPC